MDITTGPPAIARRPRSPRWRSAGYWLATVAVAAELAVGGLWDIMRLPSVRDLVMHLGYPSYFLVLLGSWKVLGAAALVIPRRPVLKEWAYAGAMAVFFHLFVTSYEEPALRRRFGTTYAEYRRTVPRWIPRPPRHG